MTIHNYTHHDGVLHPIKMWTKGVELEESAQAQILNVSSLPFIYKHIAVMPDAHWGMGATVGSVIPTKGAIIPAAVGVDIGCFHGDTKIPLLDGSQSTLRELTNRDEPFWVYSINTKGEIVAGKAKALKTREHTSVMKVIVSGGDEIICTPDHQFMLSDGTYKEAKDLKFNDSLMPLYRKWQTRDGYESVSNGKGKSKQTHVMVWESLNGSVDNGYVVHHRNHNHFDNTPDNLCLMTTSEHSSYHRRNGHSFNNSDQKFQEKRLAGISRRAANPEKRKQMSEVGEVNIRAYMANNPQHFKESIRDNGKRGKAYLVKFNTSPRVCDDCGSEERNPSALRWHKKKEHQYNHKVISVFQLPQLEDVYCLQVEDHNNFALSAGVFVHNCGMMATRTNIRAEHLPDSLVSIRSDLEAAIPHGRTNDGREDDRGAWYNIPDANTSAFLSVYCELERITDKHPKLSKAANRAPHHIGTLGTGNHFVELCLDTEGFLWIMLHSGSRGIGNAIGTYFINLAKEDMRKWFINLPDGDLAYLPEGTEHFYDYMEAVRWAQGFARINRETMMTAALGVVKKHFPDMEAGEIAVNCHHNYVNEERHFGEKVFVTRKGAVRAFEGDLGIIPGSMGAKSFIVRGKGNRDSFCSCSHGAGRKMSRTQARKVISLEQHAEATKGVECRKDEEVLDESPAAYKDIDTVMLAQADLVDIVFTLKQIVCVKG